MELDDLKPMWAALESTRALNVELLRELKMNRARSALIPSQVMRVIELVLGVCVLLLCAPVVVSHGASWRYLVFGVPCLVFMGVTTALSAYLLVRMRQLSFDGPLLTIQREVAELRRLELRATLIALLGGIVLWLPIALLFFEALSHAPLLELADLAWLASNLAVGFAAIALGRQVMRRYHQVPESPLALRFFDALTGHGLRAISVYLEQLTHF